MDVNDRKVPTLIERKTDKTNHKLTLDVAGCEDAAKEYLDGLGITYKLDDAQLKATFSLDTENDAENSALDTLITDAGVGKKIAGYGIVRALAFPLEFHEEVEETDYGKVAAATTVLIGDKKKRDKGLWLWEYIIPVLLALIVGVGYAGLATHQRNMDTYVPVTIDQLKGEWYQEYSSISGFDAWLHPATNKFFLSFPLDSIITETKKYTLVASAPDTILIVGNITNTGGIWYPDEKQFVGSGEEPVTFLNPDSAGVEDYAANIVDPMTLEYNKVDRFRNYFEEGQEKKDAQLTGRIVIEENDFFLPVKSGKIKIITQNELQKLFLPIAQEATLMGHMRFYQWINENDPNRSRKETQIIGEFDLNVAKILGKYM
ncbi:MAG: hypothetical protein JSV84_12520 [Gemmatimonadota bacterium]|nr:MAG: hypothetical protein JSV84_12520 [Gemmatimonadota bacterium]